MTTAETRKGKLRIIAMIVLGVSAAAGLSVAAHSWGESRVVAEVRIRGNEYLSEGAIFKRSGIALGDRLFEVDLFAVRRKILEDPFVRDAVVQRDAPGAIVITVMERTPVAAIASVPMRFVDKDGWVMPIASSGRVIDVPVLSGYLGLGGLGPGKQFSSPGLSKALEMAVALQTLSGVNGRISEIHLTRAEDIILFTSEGGIPVLAGRGRIADKILSFDAFWEQVVMRGGSRQLRLVDIRYEGQVIAEWSPGGPTQG